MLPGATDAIEGLASEFGLSVNWTKFNELWSTDPKQLIEVMHLASVRAFAASITEQHQPGIEQALDHAYGAAGLEDEEVTAMATTYFAVNVDQHDQKQAAIADAEGLVNQLKQQGVLEPAATES